MKSFLYIQIIALTASNLIIGAVHSRVNLSKVGLFCNYWKWVVFTCLNCFHLQDNVVRENQMTYIMFQKIYQASKMNIYIFEWSSEKEVFILRFKIRWLLERHNIVFTE